LQTEIRINIYSHKLPSRVHFAYMLIFYLYINILIRVTFVTIYPISMYWGILREIRKRVEMQCRRVC